MGSIRGATADSSDGRSSRPASRCMACTSTATTAASAASVGRCSMRWCSRRRRMLTTPLLNGWLRRRHATIRVTCLHVIVIVTGCSGSA